MDCPPFPRTTLLDACFLGPYGGTTPCWKGSWWSSCATTSTGGGVISIRRDPPAISRARRSSPNTRPSRRACDASCTSSAALKKSVPFHSPRYLGHMVSDLLLPGWRRRC